MIIISLIYTTQSLEQRNLTIISALKILSSRSLVSQIRLVDYINILVLAWKVETRKYFYNKKSSANWTKNHICKSSMQLLSSQIIPLSCKTDNCWCQDSLPLKLRFSCWNPLGRNNYFQQCHFDPWLPIYFCIYWKLFSLFTHGTLQINQNTFLLDSWRNTHPVQYVLSCWKWSLYVLRITKSHVWAKTFFCLALDNIVKLIAPMAIYPSDNYLDCGST